MNSRRLIATLTLSVLVLGGLLGYLAGQSSEEVRTPMRAPATPHVREPSLLMREQTPDMAERTREQPETVEPIDTSLDAWSLSGVVRDTGGTPIPGALVYVVAKNSTGAHDPTGVPNVAGDDEGTFRISSADLSNSWLGAIAEGFMPAFVDLDKVAKKSSSLQLVLEHGKNLEVILDDGADGLGVSSSFVRVESDSRGTSAPLPAPDVRPSVVIVKRSGTERRVVFRVGTWGRVLVRVVRWGYVTVPPFVELPEPEGVVHFSFRKSCGILFRVYEGSKRVPFTSRFHVQVHEAKSNRFVNGGSSQSVYGEFELRDRIPTGAFVVSVRASGFSTWTSQTIRLSEPGARRTVDVHLQENGAIGSLQVTYESDNPVPTEETKRPVPTILLRKKGTSTWLPPRAWEFGSGPRTFLVRDLAPGSYDLLLWSSDSPGHVGLLTSVEIDAGSVASTNALLDEGVTFRIPASKAHGVSLAEVRFEAAGRLPVVRVEPSQSVVYDGGIVRPENRWIGPYPKGSTSELSRSDGPIKLDPLPPIQTGR